MQWGIWVLCIQAISSDVISSHSSNCIHSLRQRQGQNCLIRLRKALEEEEKISIQWWTWLVNTFLWAKQAIYKKASFSKTCLEITSRGSAHIDVPRHFVPLHFKPYWLVINIKAVFRMQFFLISLSDGSQVILKSINWYFFNESELKLTLWCALLDTKNLKWTEIVLLNNINRGICLFSMTLVLNINASSKRWLLRDDLFGNLMF